MLEKNLENVYKTSDPIFPPLPENDLLAIKHLYYNIPGKEVNLRRSNALKKQIQRIKSEIIKPDLTKKLWIQLEKSRTLR